MLRLSVDRLDFTAHLSAGICLRASKAYRLYRDYRRPATLHLMRHPFESTGGTGILTRFPSATPFGLALGAD